MSKPFIHKCVQNLCAQHLYKLPTKNQVNYNSVLIVFKNIYQNHILVSVGLYLCQCPVLHCTVQAAFDQVVFLAPWISSKCIH